MVFCSVERDVPTPHRHVTPSGFSPLTRIRWFSAGLLRGRLWLAVRQGVSGFSPLTRIRWFSASFWQDPIGAIRRILFQSPNEDSLVFCWATQPRPRDCLACAGISSFQSPNEDSLVFCWVRLLYIWHDKPWVYLASFSPLTRIRWFSAERSGPFTVQVFDCFSPLTRIRWFSASALACSCWRPRICFSPLTRTSRNQTGA